MKIAMISDVHEQWHDLVIPPCDLLVSAGDYSYLGKPHIVEQYHRWLDGQPAQQIISVQGNHEKWVEKNFLEAEALVKRVAPRINFIGESGVLVVEGRLIYASAVTPWFHDWAWNKQRGDELKNFWKDTIPDDVEIIITHGPPLYVLDQIDPKGPEKSGSLDRTGAHLGCEELRKRIRHLPKLKLHVFGHIHGSSGILDDVVHAHADHRVVFVNASICDEKYKPTNPVRVFELEDDHG